MATKKIDKKTEKKTDKKAVTKVVSKATRPPKGVPEPTITVPRGGQVIGIYELSPQLPVKGRFADWTIKMLDEESGSVVPVPDDISVSFNKKSRGIQLELERAVLVIKLAETDNGHWRFALNGIDVFSQTGELEHPLESEIIDYGRTLVLYLHAHQFDKKAVIKFSYVVAYTDPNSGETTIYESKDPVIGVGRPFP